MAIGVTELLILLGLPLLIANLVCWVIVVISAFQKENSPLLGILSIVLGFVGAFVIGWVRAREWRLVPIMSAWSVLLAIVAGLTFVIPVGIH